MTDPSPTGQIASLLAWARRLTEQGRHADPDDRAAYQTAKARLLADLSDIDRHDPPGDTA